MKWNVIWAVKMDVFVAIMMKVVINVAILMNAIFTKKKRRNIGGKSKGVDYGIYNI